MTKESTGKSGLRRFSGAVAGLAVVAVLVVLLLNLGGYTEVAGHSVPSMPVEDAQQALKDALPEDGFSLTDPPDLGIPMASIPDSQDPEELPPDLPPPPPGASSDKQCIDPEFVRLVQQYDDWDHRTMQILAWYESSCNTNPVGDKKPINGIQAESCGYFQIRTKGPPGSGLEDRPDDCQLLTDDVAFNVEWAHRIWVSQGPNAWHNSWRKMQRYGDNPIDPLNRGY